MTDQDGMPLSSTSHPVAPWWKRLWMWIAFWRYRDVSKSSVEVVEIEIKRGEPRTGAKTPKRTDP